MATLLTFRGFIPLPAAFKNVREDTLSSLDKHLPERGRIYVEFPSLMEVLSLRYAEWVRDTLLPKQST